MGARRAPFATLVPFLVAACDLRAADHFVLRVVKAGAGTGVVQSVGPGIDCGPDCAEELVAGATIVLTATAGERFAFDGWYGPCSGRGECRITMDGDHSVLATFELGPSEVAVTVEGRGRVRSSPVGINCGDDCTEQFAIGTPVTLEAVPEAGARFTGWSGACRGTSATCDVIASAVHRVTATFGAGETLTVARAGAGDGRISSIPGGIDCGLACSAAFERGASVELLAAADASSVFAGWSGDCAGTSTCSFTLDRARRVSAIFEPRLVPLVVTREGDGGGTVISDPPGIDCGETCSATFTNGAPIVLTATPDADSELEAWGGACMGDGDCTLSLHAPAAVAARFTAKRYTIALEVDGAGRVDSDPPALSCPPRCSATFPARTRMSLVAIPDAGATFAEWTPALCMSERCELEVTADQSFRCRFAPR